MHSDRINNMLRLLSDILVLFFSQNIVNKLNFVSAADVDVACLDRKEDTCKLGERKDILIFFHQRRGSSLDFNVFSRKYLDISSLGSLTVPTSSAETSSQKDARNLAFLD